jgi:Transposase DDE domain
VGRYTPLVSDWLLSKHWIRRKIVGIALGLVVLMIATSILSTLMANRVGHLLDELTNKYVPAYGDLARANVRSLERALALRQMVIAKMQTPPDDAAFAQRMQIYRTKDAEVTEEAEAARKLIGSIIEDAVSCRERKKVEMLFAHLKRILRLGRLRLRGPSGAKDEFLLAATAQNLRKLAKLIPLPAPIFAT